MSSGTPIVELCALRVLVEASLTALEEAAPGLIAETELRCRAFAETSLGRQVMIESEAEMIRVTRAEAAARALAILKDVRTLAFGRPN